MGYKQKVDGKQAGGGCPRFVYLDFIRIAACYLVIYNHTSHKVYLPLAPSKTWYLCLALFFLCKTAVPLFLMTSGAVLLGREESLSKCLKRVGRILAVIVAFSFLVYLAVNPSLQSLAPGNIGLWLLSIYHTNITNAYWYLYLYVGLLLMLPIIRKMVAGLGRREYQYFFFWSFVFLGTMPILVHYQSALQYSTGIPLTLFSANFGYLLAGYYFHEKVKPSGKGIVLRYVAGIAVPIAVCVLLTRLEYNQNPENYLFLDHYITITAAVPSLCIFRLIQYGFTRFPPSKAVQKWIVEVGRCTFGIYLLSDLFIRYLEPAFYFFCRFTHPFIAACFWQAGVFACGLAVTWLLRKIPIVAHFL